VAPGRLKVPTLLVSKGRTDRKEYTLSDKLTVIGKSGLATIKLKGWFAPKVAAQITRREDNFFYISSAERVPSVNGTAIAQPCKLSSGDVVEVAGIVLEFVYRD